MPYARRLMSRKASGRGIDSLVGRGDREEARGDLDALLDIVEREGEFGARGVDKRPLPEVLALLVEDERDDDGAGGGVLAQRDRSVIGRLVDRGDVGVEEIDLAL